MVDFTNLKKEEDIKTKLHSLIRQGRKTAVAFPSIEIADFLIQVHATDNPDNPKCGAWILQDLVRLDRIPDLNKLNVKIYQKRPNSQLLDVVQIYIDKRFKEVNWASKFVQNVGKITPNELIEIIRYLQVITDMVAFI
jgi:hypothetical protein